MTDSSKSLINVARLVLEASRRPQIVMCAYVFFNCSRNLSSPISIVGIFFSTTTGGSWYTFPERVIYCIHKAAGSNASEVEAWSLGASFSIAWDQLKTRGKVSVMQIVFLGAAWTVGLGLWVPTMASSSLSLGKFGNILIQACRD